MKADLIRIGNSQGIRIPKPIIEQCGFRDQVELSVDGDALVIRPARAGREGWEESFRAMAAQGDDALLDAEATASDWDNVEWEW